MHQTAIVLGAGLQGVAVTLALIARGWKVTLIEQDERPLNRASLRNEGKIHLGFVYANDSSGRTSRLMLESALSFAPLLEGWLGTPIAWDRLRSRPFTYCLATNSLVPRDVLESRYEALQKHFLEIDGPVRPYLGKTLQQLYFPLGSAGAVPELLPSFAVPLISTGEVAIDLVPFCNMMVSAVRSASQVSLRCGHQVREAERSRAGFRVIGTRQDGCQWAAEADILVNCLWENRLLLDATLGIRPTRPWVHRLKYRVLALLPPTLARVPALTFVLGPYGDIVTYPSGSAYLSYYPEALRGWSNDVAPPADWANACRGEVPASTADQLAQRVLGGLENVLPGIGASIVTHVDAGAIFAWGSTDIDDAASELHNRHDTGVHAYDGYYSIDTGKLTSAPLFAKQLVDLLS